MEEAVCKTLKCLAVALLMGFIMACLSNCVSAPTPAFETVSMDSPELPRREEYEWTLGDELDVQVKLGEMKQAYLDSMTLDMALELTTVVIEEKASIAGEYNRAVKWIKMAPWLAAGQTAIGVGAGVGAGIIVGLLIRR